jgi:hypothetical protein
MSVLIEEWERNEEVVVERPHRPGPIFRSPEENGLPTVWTQQWPVERPRRRPVPTVPPVIVEDGVEPPLTSPAWDPILISLVRRAMPNLIAYDICGVQPMTGPTGLIFAMRSRYDSGKQKRKNRYEDDRDSLF